MDRVGEVRGAGAGGDQRVGDGLEPLERRVLGEAIGNAEVLKP